MAEQHGQQFYGERSDRHSQISQVGQEFSHQRHSISQQSNLQQTNQRSTLPEVQRQRPTHPDFAHLRQQQQRSTTNPEISQSRLSSQENLQIRSVQSQPRLTQQQNQSATNNTQQYTHASMKRSFNYMENGYDGNTSSSIVPSNSVSVSAESGGGYYPQQSLINVAQHTQNVELFNHRYSSYDTQTHGHIPLIMDGKSPKRYKKGEASLLFSPPFFKILPLPYQLAGMVSPHHKDAISAQCYACGRIVRGNKSISSNFIKHMKRSHPEISKIYDTYKIFRIKAGIMPNISSMVDVKSEAEKAEGTAVVPEDPNDSNDEHCSSYFDPTSMLDVAEMIEEENHSENSENIEDSMPSGETSENNDPKKNPNRSEESHVISENLMEAINKIVDTKLKDYVKFIDLPKVQNDFKEIKSFAGKEDTLKTTCDHKDVDDLKMQMQQLKQECQALRAVVQQSQASKRRLQQELQIVDKMLHQKKLIIRHLKIENPLEPQEAVQKLFKDKLKLENIELSACSIIPPTNPTTPQQKNKECLIIELKNPKNVKTILREAHKLKDTGIFIEPEISPFLRKRKNKLMVLRKELLRRQPNLKVLVRNTTLIVNSKNFYWDDVEGLMHTGNGEALELSGVQYLKSASGLDMTEFVEVLKNYDVQLKE